jgi:hypothetical protein
MQIIGHTKYGYLVEMDSHELSHITGNPQDAQHAGHNSYYGGRHQETHPIGTKFNVSETWKHLKEVLATEQRRKQIAESLRAAATLIEHTPQPITPLPVEQPTTEG